MPTSSSSVVVYVTREHPRSGIDQLLVFDVVDEPEYTAVVPGGRLDPGESVEEGAVRDVREETGIDVEVVRDLGAYEGRHAMHFLQAVPVGQTPDEWEHRNPPRPGIESESLVRCRWIQIRPGLDLWGERGALVEALIRRRVVVYVTRERNGVTELLTIEVKDMPELGREAPAGRLDLGESLEEGLRRELEEETGLVGIRILRELPGFEARYQSFCENHAFHVVAEADTPDVWEHRVLGDGADSGMVHLCRWVPLEPDLKLWRNEGDPMVAKLSIEGA
jgi:ADP-ribose pyrophosphatase YjhB (NUDIX family)